MDWLQEFITENLSFTGKCYRHCDRPTKMNIIVAGSDRLVAAYTCPDGFVSQVVYFGPKPDVGWFVNWITDQVGKENFDERDIRLASRHGWELGKNAQETLEDKLGSGAVIKQLYWTRYPKTEQQKQQAVSLCVGDASKPGCRKLFIHDNNSTERLCPTCSAN
jgi:hypothetical protein